MNASVRLGRILGIDVGLNWSWLFVFALVVWSLAASVFPSQDPGLSGTTYWTMALAATAAFFASILLHEFGHALVARREGVAIDGITLWIFGGVARLRGRMPSAGAEFRIAIGGPVVTALIATVLLLVAGLTTPPRPVDGTIFWVGYINATLLVFNLIPAVPLDGGRLLHAALWAWRGDLVSATRIGTAVAYVLGSVMVGAGISTFAFGIAAGGLWLAVMGWFLTGAARAEAQQVIARERLGGLRLRDVMVADPVTVEADASIGQVIDEVARRHRHSTYPVLEEGRPVGLLPFRRVAATPRDEWDERRVRDCMVARADVPTLSEEALAADAFDDLAATDLHRALVVADGHLAGIVSITDLIRTAGVEARAAHE